MKTAGKYWLCSYTERAVPLASCMHAATLRGLGWRRSLQHTVKSGLAQLLPSGSLRERNTWVSYENRVVLGTPAQDADTSTDFLISANDGVELRCFGGEVCAVLLQRLKFLVCCVCVYACATASHTLQRIVELPFAGTCIQQQAVNKRPRHHIMTTNLSRLLEAPHSGDEVLV